MQIIVDNFERENQDQFVAGILWGLQKSANEKGEAVFSNAHNGEIMGSGKYICLNLRTNMGSVLIADEGQVSILAFLLPDLTPFKVYSMPREDFSNLFGPIENGLKAIAFDAESPKVDDLAKLNRLEVYDCAIPQDYFNKMHDALGKVPPAIVWCYDKATVFGEPVALTHAGKRALERVKW